MGRVICDMSISLDGYVTGPNDSRENPFGDGAGQLHDWFSGAATDQDRAVLQQMVDATGGGHGPHILQEKRGRRRLERRGPARRRPVLCGHPPRALHALFTRVHVRHRRRGKRDRAG